MTKTISTDKARQGKQGLPVLKVLIAALILAAIVWGGLEIWGEQIAPPTTATDGAPAATTSP